MLVIPRLVNYFQDFESLHLLLLECQQAVVEKRREQVVSISTKIECIDPLAVLNVVAHPTHRHFYFETRQHGILTQDSELQLKSQTDEGLGLAIVAIDSATSLTVSGDDRFSQAQHFIDTCLAETIKVGCLDLPFSGPHFFCSFTFFPTSSSFPAATVFLPRWQLSRYQQHCILVANVQLNSTTNIHDLAQDLWQNFHKITQVKYSTPHITIHHHNTFSYHDITDPDRFKTAIAAALQLIHKGQLHKVVLAHAIDILSPLPFHLIYSLNHLRTLYPDCYVFSTSNGAGQTFIGASPERLMRVYNDELITDALAGSAPRGATAIEDTRLAETLLSSAKERYEHQIVVDFILQRLHHLGLVPRYFASPQLLQLTNIQHLQTLIQAAVSPGVHPLEILAELHPTPAVAGVPRDLACDQIQQCESFERSLYAAPLGWIDHQGNAEFIVGIRSALIEGCRARLYAGAGIVAGSDPTKELAEIRLKLQALWQALL